MARLRDVNHDKLVHRIPATLEQNYGITVQRVDVVKSVYRVVDDNQYTYYVKLLKDQNNERIEELHRVSALLTSGGLSLAAPIATRSGRYVVVLDDGIFAYVQPGLKGRHADFRQRCDRLTGVAAAAHLHRLGSSINVKWLKTPVGLPLARKLAVKRNTFLRVLPEALRHLRLREKDKRDILFALYLWDREPSTVMRVVTRRSLCHRDFAPHNLLVDETVRGVSMIDFDLAGFDHPFVDLVQIVNHSVTLCDVHDGLFTDTVEVYRTMTGFSPLEERWLWQLFWYPDVLVRSVLQWAEQGYAEDGEESVRQAVDKERLRADRLTQECPLRLY